MQHHNYSLREIEGMIPWEREIYVSMLIEYLKEEKQSCGCPGFTGLETALPLLLNVLELVEPICPFLLLKFVF